MSTSYYSGFHPSEDSGVKGSATFLPPSPVAGNFILDQITGVDWEYINAQYSPSTVSGSNIYDRLRATFLTGVGSIKFGGNSLEELRRFAVTPGQTYYMYIWLYKATAATGNVSGKLELYDAAGAYIETIEIPNVTTVGASLDSWFQGFGQWTSTSGVAYARPIISGNTGGNSNTLFVAMPYFGSQQLGADVSASALGPLSHTFNYSSTGVLDPISQMPRSFTYRFSTLSGTLTSDVTWNYRVLAGTINGFSSGPTLRSMTSASGVGTLTVTSLDSNSADIEVIGTSAGGQAVSARVSFTKVFAAPGTTGGAGAAATASQTSGFLYLPSTQTSFLTITNELEVTATTTTLSVNVNLEYALEDLGSVGMEMIAEQWNGSAWVSMGTTETATASYFFSPVGGGDPIFQPDVGGESYINPAIFIFSRTLAITAGTAQKVRLRLRRASGDSIGAGGYGTFSISA